MRAKRCALQLGTFANRCINKLLQLMQRIKLSPAESSRQVRRIFVLSPVWDCLLAQRQSSWEICAYPLMYPAVPVLQMIILVRF